ncbi:MAG: glycosyltransferase family 4 protein, partial [Dermatophilaceae bacterium]
KNQRLLIDGFAGFVHRGGEGDLLILGAVGDEGYLRECQAAAAPARGRVHFLGPKSRDEVVTYVARAKACVSTSLRETSSIAIVEALAANCPVLTLDVGTAREHLGPDGAAGVVLPLDSTPGDLTEAFFGVASRPAQSGRLRSRVIAHHPDRVARETLGVYAGVAG